jgi:sugar O-acyltransferase (sialic acid O-acetyltransferase NeuD family)
MEVLTPRVNANDNEAKVTAWHAARWQAVARGDLVCSIETTKASVDVEVNTAGFFYPAVEVGDTVKVGEILAWVFPKKDETLLAKAKQAREPSTTGDIVISAKARALMKENGLDVSAFADTAAISARDVEDLIHSRRSSSVDADAVISSIETDDDAVLIWGGGYQGQVVLDILRETGAAKPVAVIDRNPRIERVSGLPVLRPQHVTKLFEHGLRKAHICIGNAADKIDVAAILKAVGFTLVNVIHPSAVISPAAKLGENVYVGPLVLIGVDVVIGDLSQLNNGASIAHHSCIGRAVQVSDGAKLGGIVRIGDGSLIGIGTVVNSRVSVGQGCTLVSGITIYENVKDGTVVRADGAHVLLADNVWRSAIGKL